MKPNRGTRMSHPRTLRITALLALLTAAALSLQAAEHPEPQEGEWIVENFQFQN
ncbi:MAG: hypothetical protein GWN29_03120, partial [Gammaproteobacteria bacterium]|nr:hypothetical protein [Gammaproteobacteria bacterium]